MSKNENIHQDHENRITKLECIIENISSTLIRLENRLEKIDSNARSDFRWLLGFIIAGYASLFGIIAHALKWI